jgi:hypothetical protein
MMAGRILSQLVGSQRRIELTNVRGVRVAFATELWNIHFADMSAKSGGFAHRAVRIVVGGISAMATRAGESLLNMDILVE